MIKAFGLWLLTCFAVSLLMVGIAPFAHGGEPDRRVEPPMNLLDILEPIPEKNLGAPVPNPPVLVQKYPPGCEIHAKVVELLKETHKEVALVIGVTNNNYLLEIFGSSFQDGTFTLVITNTNGVACMIDAGTQLNFLIKMIPDAQAEGQSHTP